MNTRREGPVFPRELGFGQAQAPAAAFSGRHRDCSHSSLWITNNVVRSAELEFFVTIQNSFGTVVAITASKVQSLPMLLRHIGRAACP